MQREARLRLCVIRQQVASKLYTERHVLGEDCKTETELEARLLQGINISVLTSPHLNVDRDNLLDFFQTENYEQWLAPYFAMVQSSGMGKTKLLLEAFQLLNQDHSGYACRLLLCTPRTTNMDNLPPIYRGQGLQLVPDKNELVDHLWQQLDGMIAAFAAPKSEPPTKAVLLIDEAQWLLEKHMALPCNVCDGG